MVGPLNVQTLYGAYGDGIHDDSLAIQNAITAALAQPLGGQVYFPTGTYMIGTQVQIPKTIGKFIDIVGDGAGFSVFSNVAGFSQPLFYVGSTLTTGGSGVTFRDIGFNGTDSTASHAVTLVNANITVFDRVNFLTWFVPVQMNGCYGVRFTDCMFVTIGCYAIYSYTCANHTVIDKCSFFNTGIAGAATIQFAQPAYNIVIRDCDFETGWCFVLLAQGGSSLILSGNYMEYASNIPFYSAEPLYGASITGNWISLSSTLYLYNIIDGYYTCNTSYNQSTIVASGTSTLSAKGNVTTGTGTALPDM